MTTGFARPAIRFVAIETIDDFAKIVERTYLQTMDCPLLSSFRSAEQTLASYRLNDAFASDLWYAIFDSSDHVTAHSNDSESAAAESNLAVETAVGCLLMGRHLPRRTTGQQPSADNVTASDVDPHAPTSPSVVSELVYMGLVPEARGNRLGRQILKRAATISLEMGATRLILAVDESNEPARNLYRGAGMRPMMRESVWGKLLTVHS